MAKQDQNDELCGLIGALGSSVNAARDESLSDDDRAIARDLTDGLADRLRDEKNT
ncbi:hypothetical protein ACWCO0_09385 [Streptomyces tubercidicus]